MRRFFFSGTPVASGHSTEIMTWVAWSLQFLTTDCGVISSPQTRFSELFVLLVKKHLHIGAGYLRTTSWRVCLS